MSERRPSPLFEGDAARSNLILARTFYNELVRSGRSRSQIIDLVNMLLGMVLGGQGRGRPATNLLIDPENGFPSQIALQELILHELDPATERSDTAALALFEAPRSVIPLILAQKLRHNLRPSDVVALMRHNRVGCVIFLPSPAQLPNVKTRVEKLFKGDLAGVTSSFMVLKSGTHPRALWRELVSGLST
ncbi:MAG: hypothetical protein ACT4TC_24905 [Myxococcaceae bacterium]